MATILLIDDDYFFSELVKLHLLLTGYTVQTAKDPAEGLRAIVDGPPPDLVLLDLDLPYLSGFEVLEALRSDPATRGIPVIILTARKDEDSYARCSAAGIDGYHTKPPRRKVESIRHRTRKRLPWRRKRVPEPFRNRAQCTLCQRPCAPLPRRGRSERV